MKKSFYFIVSLVIAIGCKQVYEPNVETKNIRLLVAEGFINSGQGPTIIHLSRSVNLQDTGTTSEVGATVKVEGDDGSAFLLTDDQNGRYSIPQLSLGNNVKYRLHIKTADAKEYASDYSAVKFTPQVDSITWQKEDDGLRIYVHAHDAQNKTKYYQWKYEETWEFHATYYSSLKYIRDGTNRITALVWRYQDHSVDTTIYKCWNTMNSTSIILGSSEKLSSDVIYLPVQFIEPGSEKLSVLYSLYLKQYAVSQDAYLFMGRMKKNTEQVGSLFDAQPSQLSGNIHCLTDPKEPVIGFVEITQEQVKRVFIYNGQVPGGWSYASACIQFVLDNDLDSIAKHGAELYPTVPFQLGAGGDPVTFYAANSPTCIDCTTRGVNKKPSFWP